MNTIRLFLFTVLLFTMSAFALGETLLRSAARRRLNDITLTLTAPGGASAVRMTGPWWGWSTNGGPVAADNSDGTWTVTFDPVPDEDMLYLWVVDGNPEVLWDNAANAECTAKIDDGSLITDYWSYANRVWVLDSGDVADTYDSCVIQDQGCMDATATNYNPDATMGCGGCCEYSGCMDVNAWNYDPDATMGCGGCCVFIPAAPVPTDPANSVLSIFSDAYTDQEGTVFNPDWGQATQVAVGDNLVYTGLNYQGTQFENQDVSGYAYLNVDYYVTESTPLYFFLIGSAGETAVALDVSETEQWVNVQIPLSSYSSVNLADVFQFKVDGNGQTRLGQVAFNNIYFGGVAVLGCMDDTAENYNPDANVDDGRCVYGNYVTYCATEVTHFNIDNHLYPILLTVENSGDNSMRVTATSVNDVIDVLNIENVRGGGTVSATTIANGVATAEITWSNMPAATSFRMLWSDDTSDGNSMLKVGDGTDGLGNIDTSNVCEVYGCTDPSATNYDSAATVDDGSCTYTGGTGATIALPVDFEEAADAYEIAGFDGGVASVEVGPGGATSLKYVKGAGQDWAGVWINLDTAVDPANGEIITAKVYSTVARDITLKFDAANAERVVSHGGTGWEALSYDFTGVMPADQTKIVFFNDLTQPGDGTDAWIIYIDNLAQTSGGGTQLTITTTVCETASNVTIFGPWWNNWDPNVGPEAADNGDGTWTFTFDPAPTDNMEYKLLVDGEQENLIGKGGCAPITDGLNYANRQWFVGSENVVNTYGTCGNCDDLVDEPDPPARIPRPKLDDKWHLQIECIAGLQNCWANGEKQHYTDRLENAYVSGGHLHIVAKKKEYVSQGVERSYTSARLNSKYHFKYGTVKVRAKLPKQNGLWPAIWTLGSDISEKGVHDFVRISKVNWPYCGEIDIMEQYGTQNFVGSAMHGPSYPVITNAADGNAIPWNTAELSPSVDDFHVYSMEWTAAKITFKVDDVAYKTVTAPSDKTNWPFDHKHFLLLNVAVEGITHKTGFIADDFVSGEMVVDYVRIYGENGDLNWSDEFGSADDSGDVSVSDCPGLKEAFQANCDCGVEYTSFGSLASVVPASDCSGLKKAYKENCDCSQ